MPIPKPPVGGIPYSKAVKKSSSTPCASKSPAAFLSACASNLCRWSMGSVNSEKLLANSRPTTYNSNLSTRSVFERWGLAKGEISTGKSSTKVGCIRVSSTFCSKASFKSLPMVLQSSGTPMPAFSAAIRADSKSSKLFKSTPVISWTNSCIVTRRQGGVRSISLSW